MISGLYVVSNLDLLKNNSGLNLKQGIQAALAGGVKTIQLREPMLAMREYFEIAQFALEAAHDFGARVLINDRVDLMQAVGADGVHLGWRSLAVDVVRKMIGPDKIIGVSTHNMRECREAEANGADYVTLGPVFSTPSKYGILDPLGLELVTEIASSSNIPIVAIGGITPELVNAVLECGVATVAVMSGIMAAADVRQAARSYAGFLAGVTRH